MDDRITDGDSRLKMEVDINSKAKRKITEGW